jgi:hypothetical protein
VKIWYPNRKQWVVIWATAFIAAGFLLNGEPAPMLAALLFGVLLIWQLSKPSSSRANSELSEKYAKCSECGAVLNPYWKNCPMCGSSTHI